MKIKEKPEDFLVEEIAEHEYKKTGKYAVFILEKNNLNTLEAIEKIGNILHIGLKRFGFAGTKDKRAVTRQYVSCFGVNKEQLERIKADGIKIEFLGYKDEPISLGDLKGNSFVIRLKELSKEDIKKIESRKSHIFKNYFGEQRFGTNNAEIGKAIVKGDFKKAYELLKQQGNKYIKDVKGQNHAAEIKKIPLKLRKMFLHAYQSMLWNNVVEKVKSEEVPIFGFGTEFDEDDEIKKTYEEMMKREAINQRDFIIRKMPELSAEGEMRKANVEAKELSFEIDGKEAVLKFVLPKGSYATSVIDQIFK